MEETSDLQVLRLAVFAAVIAVVLGLALAGLLGAWLARRGRRAMGPGERAVARAAWTCAAGGVLCFGWGFVEPHWLEETHHEITSERLDAGTRLRIVHFSDLHVASENAVLRELPERVNALHPDLVVFTGDSLNDAAGLAPFRAALGRMHATYGVFAVRGNHDTNYWSNLDLFGGVATELRGAEPVLVADGRVALCGAAFGLSGHLAGCVAAAPRAYRVVAYHTPDLVEDFGAEAPDLYLAGHTHGGQVRLPWYGAIITLSRFDKKYEAGLGRFERTTINVNRGVGLEPGAPPVRFWCRPELSVIDVVGTRSGR